MNKKMLKLSSYLENHLLSCLFISIKILVSNGGDMKSHFIDQEANYFFK